MRISQVELGPLCRKNNTFQLGCVLDTNILFAASYPTDQYNEWAESTFSRLIQYGIPRFTNINVRSEFLDLSRRVLIPEGLMDFYGDYSTNVTGELENKLKSLRTRINNASNRAFKLNDIEIKQWRRLLDAFKHPSGKLGWDVFCDNYLEPYFKDIWGATVKALDMKSLGNSAFQDDTYFSADPTWDQANQIIGKTGIGSTDAMLINFFLCSKFNLMISTDSDVTRVFQQLGVTGRYLLTP